MKKRFFALALALVFTCSLFAVPKAKAVVAEATAVGIGTAVLASYMAASGLDFTVDSAETVSTGLESLAGDFLTATESTETADSWFATISGLVTMPGDGVLQIPATVIRMVGAFTNWLTQTFGLTEDGSEAVVVQGSGDPLYNGFSLPDFSSVWNNSLYPYVVFNGVDRLWFSSVPFYISGNMLCISGISDYAAYVLNSSRNGWKSFIRDKSFDSDGAHTLDSFSTPIWANHLIYTDSGDLFFDEVNPSIPDSVSLVRDSNFVDFFSELSEDSSDQLVVYVPQTITNLDELASSVPDQIASNSLNVTYELTQTGEGTGEDDDETTVGLLQGILSGVKAIPDAFTNSLTEVFTPSQEAVDTLTAEVAEKLPIIPTLQDFGAELVSNLQNPEGCANGLGLTTVIDLGKGRGTYLGSYSHDIFDVSWYLEYKDLVDDIIVGFCWLCFLWNCYGALPRIIHGEGSIAGAVSYLNKEENSDDI